MPTMKQKRKSSQVFKKLSLDSSTSIYICALHMCLAPVGATEGFKSLAPCDPRKKKKTDFLQEQHELLITELSSQPSQGFF